MDLHKIEALRNGIQQNIDQQKTCGERNRLGQFATPTELASEIMGYVLKLRKSQNITEPIKFLEPAFGTGSFYSALLSSCSSSEVAMATGVESDPVVASAALKLWAEFDLVVHNDDFCRWASTHEDDHRYNLLVTNPPYVRHHHLSKETKHEFGARILREMSLQISGLAGLYSYFILFSHKYLAPNAISAWLIPSEFMDVNYGKVLKQYFTEQVTLLSIHKYHPEEQKFADALVSSSVVVFQNRKPSESDVATLSYGEHIDSPIVTRMVTLGTLRKSDKWSMYFTKATRSVEAQEVPTISDLFFIKRGIATGNNDFFIHTREAALAKGFPEECLRPILPPPRVLKNSVIHATKDGFPVLENPLVIIDTNLPMDVLAEKHPRLWEYLNQGIKAQITEAYLLKHRKVWYKQENRPSAPFLCTYMGRESSEKPPFRFILNKSMAVATNVYLLLYPKGELSSLIQSYPNVAEEVLEELNQIRREDFSREGREYGGGLKKMEPKELGNLPASGLLERLRILQRPSLKSRLHLTS